MKVGCCSFVIKGRLGKFKSRLRDYPYLKDVSVFTTSWEPQSATKPKTRLHSIESVIHNKLSKGLAGSAFKLLKESHGLAKVTDSTVEKLRTLHPREQGHDWPMPSRVNCTTISVEDHQAGMGALYRH